MMRLVVANQRGGVAKTTTVITLARAFAESGRKVLVIDTDPQGSIQGVLGLKAGEKTLHNFLVKQYTFRDCLMSPNPNIDILCSARDTVQTEAILMGQVARELVFQSIFPTVDSSYDVVLIDVAPSISLLQTCAMIYARQILIPVSMDPLSLQGAAASMETANTLSSLFKIEIRTVGILPVMVDRRLQITEAVLESLKLLSARQKTPLLSPIRTDATVTKASRRKEFLIDFDPKSKALEDYSVVFKELTTILEDQLNGSGKK